MGNGVTLLIAIAIFVVVSAVTSVLVYKVRMKKFKEEQDR